MQRELETTCGLTLLSVSSFLKPSLMVISEQEESLECPVTYWITEVSKANSEQKLESEEAGTRSGDERVSLSYYVSEKVTWTCGY